MTESPDPADDLRTRMRIALQAAMRLRDTAAVSALRSAMAAVDNAEAADLSQAPATEISTHIAGGVAGLGAGEVRRRVLSIEELRALMAIEISERRAQAEELEELGQPEAAQRLRVEAETLEPFAAP